jgi:hypothetical protein
VPVPPTIADGQQTAQIGRRNCAIIEDGVDEIVGVTDDEILVAVRLLFERLKVVVEPSGASALAPSWPGASTWPVNAGVTLSGGNVDARKFVELMGRTANLTTGGAEQLGLRSDATRSRTMSKVASPPSMSTTSERRTPNTASESRYLPARRRRAS